jgi:Ni,Fe-hydrogenase I cytochrome b subunit
MEFKNKENKNNYLIIFKLWGSYLGLCIGLIFALQIKMNRMFLIEGSREFDCIWNPIQGLTCSDLALINIILFLLTGFVVGGLIHKNKITQKKI